MTGNTGHSSELYAVGLVCDVVLNIQKQI